MMSRLRLIEKVKLDLNHVDYVALELDLLLQSYTTRNYLKYSYGGQSCIDAKHSMYNVVIK